MVSSAAMKKNMADEILAHAKSELGVRIEKMVAQMCIDTGFNKETIQKIIDNLVTAGSVKSDGVRLWVEASETQTGGN